MTDQDYENAKKRFEKYAEKWHPLMQMGWYDIRYEYHRDFFPDDVDTVAITNSSWIYRRAKIDVSMRKIHELDDAQVEDVVVHEFAHIVLAPVTQDQPEEWHEQVEYTTQTIAVLFQHIANGGERMSHELPSIDENRKTA